LRILGRLLRGLHLRLTHRAKRAGQVAARSLQQIAVQSLLDCIMVTWESRKTGLEFVTRITSNQKGKDGKTKVLQETMKFKSQFPNSVRVDVVINTPRWGRLSPVTWTPPILSNSFRLVLSSSSQNKGTPPPFSAASCQVFLTTPGYRAFPARVFRQVTVDQLSTLAGFGMGFSRRLPI
jgi:hypothetical protein